MEAKVFTLMEDVCAANGKTDAQKNDLFKVLTTYGTVEDLEAVVAKERAKYQAVIDNLTRQYEAIKDQELTDDEIKMVYAYREGKASVVAEYVEKAEAYATQLKEVKREYENRVAKIKLALDEQ